jgi:16S rRNA (cytidine1402-2'-O)-methyltransferase
MGKLIIVPTPIGNLEDITLRSLNMLKSADLVLAEDTRVSRKLLSHYEISTPLRAFHQHNEHGLATQIAGELQEGKTYCLVSDAGTPGISDPAYLLVKACIDAGVAVECLPGATAFVPALVKSGLPCDKFCFEGFLPHKKGRNTRLKELSLEERTIVFYESPFRVEKTITQLIEYFGGDRKASVSRELTKIYEETVNGTLEEISSHFKTGIVKGEFVIVVAGNIPRKKKKYEEEEETEE